MQFQHCNKNLKRLLLLFLISSSLLSYGQIVNIENLRVKKDTIGWSGHAKLDFSLEKAVNRILDVSNELRIQYKAKKYTVFLINDIDFKEVNSNAIVNNSTQHLRFSNEITSKISFEAFLQAQSDRISEIKLRALIGAGLRFKLYTSEKYNFFLGNTVMFEYENSIDEVQSNIQRNIRNSMYLSFKLKPNKNISIVSTTYYQPRYNKLSDFRILSETSLIFNIIGNLKFTTSFSYLFDSFPVTSVPKEQFKLANGLVYLFN